MKLVYFSSVSGNTKRFVDKLGYPSVRIPIHPREEGLPTIYEPYILVVPTYGGGPDERAVPKQVVQFLNYHGRANLLGVIGTGNTNFGDTFCRAADIIARKMGVPVLGRVEIFGTDDDVLEVRKTIDMFEGMLNGSTDSNA